MRRRELTDACERGAIRERRPGDEGVGNSNRVELAPSGRMAEQSLALGREADVTVVLGEEERTDPEAVPREQRLTGLAVPDRDREVAVQAAEEVEPPLGVRLRDHLGVGRRREATAELLELGAKLDVVVDLAVLHHPVAAALVAQRLVAALEVDDREPVVGHAEAAVEVEAHAVGTAMP